MGVVPNSGSQIQGAESAPIIKFLTFGQHSPQVWQGHKMWHHGGSPPAGAGPLATEGASRSKRWCFAGGVSHTCMSRNRQPNHRSSPHLPATTLSTHQQPPTNNQQKATSNPCDDPSSLSELWWHIRIVWTLCPLLQPWPRCCLRLMETGFLLALLRICSGCLMFHAPIGGTKWRQDVS